MALTLNALTLALIIAQTGLRLAPELAASFVLPCLFGIGAVLCYGRGYPWQAGDALAAACTIKIGLLLCTLVTCLGLRLRMPLADPLLLAADGYTGVDIVAVNVLAASLPPVTLLLKTAYELTVVLCFAVLFWNLAKGDRHGFWQLVATGLTALLLTSLISLALPARGSTFTFGLQVLQGNGLPYGAGTFALEAFDYFYFGNESIVRPENLSGVVCFPSFHTVMALIIVQGVSNPMMRQLAMTCCIVTIISTIPIGGHYLTDIIGGVLVWWASAGMARWACENGAACSRVAATRNTRAFSSFRKPATSIVG